MRRAIRAHDERPGSNVSGVPCAWPAATLSLPAKSLIDGGETLERFDIAVVRLQQPLEGLTCPVRRLQLDLCPADEPEPFPLPLEATRLVRASSRRSPRWPASRARSTSLAKLARCSLQRRRVRRTQCRQHFVDGTVDRSRGDGVACAVTNRSTLAPGFARVVDEVASVDRSNGYLSRFARSGTCTHSAGRA